MRATPVVDPSVFTWPNPTLGTTLNGERCSRSLVEAMAALRTALAGAGFRVAGETIPGAQQIAGSTTQAFRMAQAGVAAAADAAGDAPPLFQVGVRMLAEMEPDVICPTFRVRPMALDLADVAFLMGERYPGQSDSVAWADAFCSQLTAAVTP
jgi:hypothetical protein